MNHKPGWQTSEFWLTALVALPSVLVAASIIPSGDQAEVGGSISKVVGGLVGAVALWKYIHSRMHLKSYIVGNGSAPCIAAVCLLFFMAPAHAQLFNNYQAQLSQITANQNTQTQIHQQLLSHAAQQTALHQQQVNLLQQIAILLAQRPQAAPPTPAPQSDPSVQALLQEILQNQNKQQAPAPIPAPPQVIVLGPSPQQQIPLGGPPLQNIPLGGPPAQNIPLGGPPQQNIPLGGPPKQDVAPELKSPPPATITLPWPPSLGTPSPNMGAYPNQQPAPEALPVTPKQDTPPKQTIPLKATQSGYQRYTHTTLLPESLWRPVQR